MSATSTTSTVRGRAITHLQFGSIGPLTPVARRIAGQPESAVKVSSHGTSYKIIVCQIRWHRRVGWFSPSAFNPVCYRRIGARLEEIFADRNGDASSPAAGMTSRAAGETCAPNSAPAGGFLK
jgi:hypothetical protein